MKIRCAVETRPLLVVSNKNDVVEIGQALTQRGDLAFVKRNRSDEELSLTNGHSRSDRLRAECREERPENTSFLQRTQSSDVEFGNPAGKEHKTPSPFVTPSC